VQSPGLETKTIETAAEAGVKCILPIKFGGDTGIERLEKSCAGVCREESTEGKDRIAGKSMKA